MKHRVSVYVRDDSMSVALKRIAGGALLVVFTCAIGLFLLFLSRQGWPGGFAIALFLYWLLKR
jgi:hypothetical protein